MNGRRSLALLAAVVALAGCGSEPTGASNRPDAAIETRRATSGELEVAVFGPTQVAQGDCAFWWSDVAGGTGPYQYAWTGVVTTDDTQDMVIGSINWMGPSYNYVTVNVTDANGKTGSGSIVVYVPAGGSPGAGC